MTDSENDFQPPWWMRNAHLQTCFAPLWAPDCPPLRWQEVPTPDGDFLDISWCGPEDAETTVLILTGLEGSVHSHYVRVLMAAAIENNWQAAVMHYRSCSGRLNLLPRFYHAADTPDVLTFIHAVEEKSKSKRLVVVGCSMGGTLLIKTLKNNQSLPIQRAVAISVPYELDKTLNEMHELYLWRFVQRFKTKLLAKIDAGQAMPIDRERAKAIRTFVEFDRLITAPMFGFSDVVHYYRSGSCRNDLIDINYPLRLLHAKDDPLVPFSSMPNADECSASVERHYFENGGHLGFVSGGEVGKLNLIPKNDWLGNEIISFLANE